MEKDNELKEIQKKLNMQIVLLRGVRNALFLILAFGAVLFIIALMSLATTQSQLDQTLQYIEQQ